MNLLNSFPCQVQHVVQLVSPEGPLLGGVVPHAGWMFSGETAAAVYRALARDDGPGTLVVLGAVHRVGLSRAAVSPADLISTLLMGAPCCAIHAATCLHLQRRQESTV